MNKPPALLAYLRFRYLASLPERSLRAFIAAVGGLIYELSLLLLPGWLRGTRLYQAVVYRMLRIAVEMVGDVQGVFPEEDVAVGELAVRKTFGNVIELMGFIALGWSPLWLLAAAADITGGSRVYLRAFVSELQKDGLLLEEVDVGSVDELLKTLEDSSGVMADLVDIPPMKIQQLRESWQSLKQNTGALPHPDQLAVLYRQMQSVAQREGRSLGTVSALVATGALRAGVQLGSVHVFNYYAEALAEIGREGWGAFALRVVKPYFSALANHFDPRRVTYTDRAFSRLQN